ncbi:MAG TPA: hypothetical protein VFB89_02405 [Gemmatimonadales bacterium]|nr:hypothetical protein [Gemmatimonadales bacterium]
MLKLTALAIAGISLLGVSGDKEWKATLAARDGSQIEGTADVKAKSADSTAMDIEIQKATASTSYAWHMHNGNCAANGSVVGAPNTYPVLKTNDKGSGEVEATLAIPAPASGEYSVHVHAPSADTAAVGMTVACGDLKPAGGDLKPGGGQ